MVLKPESLKSEAQVDRPYNQAQLQFEYGELRKELLDGDSKALQLMTVVLGVIGAATTLLTATVVDQSLKGVFPFLTELLVAVVALQTVERARTTYQKASYLRVFLEKHLDDVKWESRLQRLRQLPHKRTPWKPGLDLFEGFSGLLIFYFNVIVVGWLAGNWIFWTVGRLPIQWLVSLSVISTIVTAVIVSVLVYLARQYVWTFGGFQFDGSWQQAEEASSS